MSFDYEISKVHCRIMNNFINIANSGEPETDYMTHLA